LVYDIYAADLEGDEYKEVIAAGSSGDKGLFVLGYDGTLKWNYQWEDGVEICVTDVYAADLDGDGFKEVIVGSNTWEPRVLSYDGTVKWSSISVRTVYAADLDGYGYKEVIGGGVGYVYVYNYAGVQRWRGDCGDFCAIYAADLDGDGFKEIIAAPRIRGDTVKVFGISVLFGDFDCDGEVTVADITRVASRWRAREGGPDYAPCYDVDHDGDVDIVDIMKVAAHWGDTWE